MPAQTILRNVIIINIGYNVFLIGFILYVCQGILLVSMVNYSAPFFGKGGYRYPTAAVVLGNILAVFPLSCIFIVAAFLLFRQRDGSTLQVDYIAEEYLFKKITQ